MNSVAFILWEVLLTELNTKRQGKGREWQYESLAVQNACSREPLCAGGMKMMTLVGITFDHIPV